MSLATVFDSILRRLGLRTLRQQFLLSYALMFVLAVSASVVVFRRRLHQFTGLAAVCA